MGDDTQQEKPSEQKLKRLEEGMVRPRIILPDEHKAMVPPTLVHPAAQPTPPSAPGQPVDARPKVIPPKQSQPPKQRKPSKGK